ncbi:MAG: DUF2958 domain-containing protein [Acetobacteraceae bacterium]
MSQTLQPTSIVKPRFLTEEQHARLLENGRHQARGEKDFHPVVKLFTPDGAATWLLTEIDPDEPDVAFGLCDLGLGFPELGPVSLSELSELRGKIGLPIERDEWFTADKPLSAYADEANKAGRITV